MEGSAFIELLYDNDDCPYTPDDIGKHVESPLADGHGIHTFIGSAQIVLWERMTYGNAGSFTKVTVVYWW